MCLLKIPIGKIWSFWIQISLMRSLWWILEMHFWCSIAKKNPFEIRLEMRISHWFHKNLDKKTSLNTWIFALDNFFLLLFWIYFRKPEPVLKCFGNWSFLNLFLNQNLKNLTVKKMKKNSDRFFGVALSLVWVSMCQQFSKISILEIKKYELTCQKDCHLISFQRSSI